MYLPHTTCRDFTDSWASALAMWNLSVKTLYSSNIDVRRWAEHPPSPSLPRLPFHLITARYITDPGVPFHRAI